MRKRTKKTKRIQNGSLKDKILWGFIIITIAYLVNVAGGWQKVTTKTMYDFDTVIMKGLMK